MPTVALVPGTSVGLASGAAVLVGNPLSAPVWVRDADNPARHMFVKHVITATPATSATFIDSSFVTPLNQRLVIDYVSAALSVQPGQKVQLNILVGPPSGPRYNLVPVGVGTFFGGVDVFVASQQVTIYIDPGVTVDLITFRNTGSGFWSPTEWEIDGHLEDCTADAPCVPSP